MNSEQANDQNKAQPERKSSSVQSPGLGNTGGEATYQSAGNRTIASMMADRPDPNRRTLFGALQPEGAVQTLIRSVQSSAGNSATTIMLKRKGAKPDPVRRAKAKTLGAVAEEERKCR